MTIEQIFGKNTKYHHLKRKIEKIALVKKMTFPEAVVFCLKGASTQCAKSGFTRKNRSFYSTKGGSTRTKGGAK